MKKIMTGLLVSVGLLLGGCGNVTQAEYIPHHEEMYQMSHKLQAKALDTLINDFRPSLPWNIEIVPGDVVTLGFVIRVYEPYNPVETALYEEFKHLFTEEQLEAGRESMIEVRVNELLNMYEFLFRYSYPEWQEYLNEMKYEYAFIWGMGTADGYVETVARIHNHMDYTWTIGTYTPASQPREQFLNLGGRY